MVLEREAWVEDNYPQTDQILQNEDGRYYINTEDEDGIEKVYLPEELQKDYD